MSGLNWVQSVCKSYQHMASIMASKEIRGLECVLDHMRFDSSGSLLFANHIIKVVFLLSAVIFSVNIPTTWPIICEARLGLYFITGNKD